MISVYVMNTIKYVFIIINQIHKTLHHMTDEAYYYNFTCYMDNDYIIIQHDVYENKVLTDTEKATNHIKHVIVIIRIMSRVIYLLFLCRGSVHFLKKPS